MYLSAVCFIAALGGFLFGFDTAVISGTVGFVKQQFVLDAVMEGWFVSSALVGCVIGVSFAGRLSDSFGRKKVLFFAAFMFFISAIGSAIAVTNFFLIIARMIGGIGVGVASMLSPLYISELSPARLRGRMVTLYQFAITIGILCAYFSNAFLVQAGNIIPGSGSVPVLKWIFVDEVWRGMFGMETIPAGLFMLLLAFVPESPRWLVKEGMVDKARDVITRIAGAKTAESEIADITETVSHESGSLRQLLEPGLRIALIIGLILPALSQFSGINAIIYYGPEIFNRAGFALSDALGGQVTIGIVNVLFTVVAIWKIDSMGRRPLLMFGIAGASLSLVLVGLFFYHNVTSGFLLLSFFLLFIACFAISFGPVTWVVLSEIYPTRIRGRAMAIGTMSLWIANVILGQTFPWSLENVGEAGTFWMFAFMCVPAFILVWKVVPETKGRTLEEIERYWEKLGERH